MLELFKTYTPFDLPRELIFKTGSSYTVNCISMPRYIRLEYGTHLEPYVAKVIVPTNPLYIRNGMIQDIEYLSGLYDNDALEDMGRIMVEDHKSPFLPSTKTVYLSNLPYIVYVEIRYDFLKSYEDHQAFPYPDKVTRDGRYVVIAPIPIQFSDAVDYGDEGDSYIMYKRICQVVNSLESLRGTLDLSVNLLDLKCLESPSETDYPLQAENNDRHWLNGSLKFTRSYSQRIFM